MSGQDFARMIEMALSEKRISKGEFYRATGITATALYGWKRGAAPKLDTVKIVEKFLGIQFADYEKSEQLKELRSDLRILLNSAKDLPPSSVYALIAQIEKEKENASGI